MTIEATVNYLAPMQERAFYYLHGAPEGQPWRNTRGDRQSVDVVDGRSLNPSPSVEREGVELVAWSGAPDDPMNTSAVEAEFYPQVEAMVAHQLGAARVLAFDHNVRSGDAAREEGVQAPVNLVHNDYTEESGPQRVRDFLPDEADALLTRRFSVINVWKPIVCPAFDSPLAVCDARTLEPDQMIETELRYPDRVGEIYSFAYSPEHRWLYFPDMTPDETLLLKCYDSEHDRARFTAHTAIADPNTPADAPPRQSIEVRTLAFF
jgi:hypothetical protein